MEHLFESLKEFSNSGHAFPEPQPQFSLPHISIENFVLKLAHSHSKIRSQIKDNRFIVLQ